MSHQRIVGKFKIEEDENGVLQVEGAIEMQINGKSEILDFAQIKQLGTASSYLQQVVNALIDLEYTAKR